MQLGVIDFSEKHANIGTLFWATVCHCMLYAFNRCMICSIYFYCCKCSNKCAIRSAQKTCPSVPSAASTTTGAPRRYGSTPSCWAQFVVYSTPNSSSNWSIMLCRIKQHCIQCITTLTFSCVCMTNRSSQRDWKCPLSAANACSTWMRTFGGHWLKVIQTFEQ